MTLPDDIVEILRSLGEAPARYASIAESQGVEFLRFFIAKLVSSARLFERVVPTPHRLRSSQAGRESRSACCDSFAR